MSEAFARLSPALQFQIVNGLGFASLRPVQEQSIGPVLDGKNCVVLAPTAGGKTEAAFFPLLSLMDREDWRPVSVLYVAPIRALLNNQEHRLSRYAATIGRRTAVWHGDTAQAARKAFLRDPADILLTTPESLEVMLMSPRVPARRLFAGLQVVVIDEIHAFVGDDRGGHLSAVLERLSRIAGRDVQRIGLSATIGNPEMILQWAAGSSQRAGTIVAPGGARTPPELSLDFVGNLENAAHVVAALHPGKKRLVFVDSRRGVEQLGQSLRAAGVDTYLTHSSLSADDRRLAERAFSEARDCVIVATSALELGIDIGDLDYVLQIDAPSTVASFLQRMGRSGRREGTLPNCTFLCTDEDSLVQAAALLRLAQSGWVESIELRDKAAHLLAHQILALAIQERGVPVSDWWGWVAHATPFQALTEVDRRELLAHMLAEDILHEDGGRLSLGVRGEKLYGFRNFAELYSVFSTPEIVRVLWGAQEIGTIDAMFAQAEDGRPLVFVLSGRPWRAVRIDYDHGAMHVEPAEAGKAPSWFGRPRMLGRRLCEAIRDVLTTSDEDEWWSRRTREKLAGVRAGYGFLADAEQPLVATTAGFDVWTFAGGRANHLLSRVLEGVLGEKVTASNLKLGFREGAGKSAVATSAAFRDLAAAGRPTEQDAAALADAVARGRLSKFQPCLPPRLEAATLAAAVTDPALARAVVARVASVV